MNWGKEDNIGKEFDSKEFLLNIGLVIAALSFLTAFVGLKISEVRIAYQYYQYIYLYVILLSAMKYGMMGGISSSLALGFLMIAASKVLPQFKDMQAIPINPNVQLLLFVFFAWIAAYFSDRERDNMEEYRRENTRLLKELEDLRRETDRSIFREDEVLPDVLPTPARRSGSRRTTAPRRTSDGKGEVPSPEDSPAVKGIERGEAAAGQTPADEDKPRVIKVRSLLKKKAEEDLT